MGAGHDGNSTRLRMMKASRKRKSTQLCYIFDPPAAAASKQLAPVALYFPPLSLFFSFLYVTNNGLDLTRLKWLKAAPTSTTVRYDDQLLGSLQTVSIFRFLYSASRVIGNCIQHPSVSRQKLTQGDNDGYCELKSTPTKRGWMERTPSIFFFQGDGEREKDVKIE